MATRYAIDTNVLLRLSRREDRQSGMIATAMRWLPALGGVILLTAAAAPSHRRSHLGFYKKPNLQSAPRVLFEKTRVKTSKKALLQNSKSHVESRGAKTVFCYGNPWTKKSLEPGRWAAALFDGMFPGPRRSEPSHWQSWLAINRVENLLRLTRMPDAFWVHILCDSRFSRPERRFAAFQLFRSHVYVGEDLTRIARSLDGTRWPRLSDIRLWRATAARPPKKAGRDDLKAPKYAVSLRPPGSAVHSSLILLGLADKTSVRDVYRSLHPGFDSAVPPRNVIRALGACPSNPSAI